ncbi:hypothetical protein ES707_03858 [subsurface metagenome]
MKAIVHDCFTEIFPSVEEIKEHCGIGAGADCCIWLVVGSKFECTFYNRHPALMERWKKGLTVAKRDGCEKVKNWNPPGLGVFEF